MKAKPIGADDALHASYSRHLAQGTTLKSLIKLSKDRGLKQAEVWSHEGQYAIRYAGRDGEIKQRVLGATYRDARQMILSLSGTKVKVKVKASEETVGEASAYAYIKQGKQPSSAFMRQYEALKKYKEMGENTPTTDRALRVMVAALKAGGHTRLLSLSNSQASQIAALKKKFPNITFTPTPDGKIKARGDKVNLVGIDVNDVIKKLKAAGLSLSFKVGDMYQGKEIVEVLGPDLIRVKTASGKIVAVPNPKTGPASKASPSEVATWIKQQAGTTKMPLADLRAWLKKAAPKFGNVDETAVAAALLKLR